jgi:hypothetical protein
MLHALIPLYHDQLSITLQSGSSCTQVLTNYCHRLQRTFYPPVRMLLAASFVCFEYVIPVEVRYGDVTVLQSLFQLSDSYRVQFRDCKECLKRLLTQWNRIWSEQNNAFETEPITNQVWFFGIRQTPGSDFSLALTFN